MKEGTWEFYMTCTCARDRSRGGEGQERGEGGPEGPAEARVLSPGLPGSHDSTEREHPYGAPASASGMLSAVYRKEFFYISDYWDYSNHEWPLVKQTECWPDLLGAVWVQSFSELGAVPKEGSVRTVDQSLHLPWA